MKLYKLTDEHDQTHNRTQWGPGVTHSGTGEGNMCGPGWIHAYVDPLLAVLLNPIHVNFSRPHLWVCEGKGAMRTDGLKIGVEHCTTIERIALPVVTTEQRVRFAILCALEVYSDPDFVAWAQRWLSGGDRTKASAVYATRAAKSVYWTRTASVANYAAYYAAHAAYYAADYAAYYVADYAAHAARAAHAVTSKPGIDLVAIAKAAMK